MAARQLARIGDVVVPNPVAVYPGGTFGWDVADRHLVVVQRVSAAVVQDESARDDIADELALLVHARSDAVLQLQDQGVEHGSGDVMLVREGVPGFGLELLLPALRRSGSPVDVEAAASLVRRVGHAIHAVQVCTAGWVPRVCSGLPRAWIACSGQVKLVACCEGFTRRDPSTTGPPSWSLAYASPETVRGQVTLPPSTVFQLAVLLQELLTGVQVFRRATALETLKAIVAGWVPDMEAHGRRVPLRLAELLRASLSRNAEDRPRTVPRFLRELAPWCAGEAADAEVIRGMLTERFPARVAAAENLPRRAAAMAARGPARPNVVLEPIAIDERWRHVQAQARSRGAEWRRSLARMAADPADERTPVGAHVVARAKKKKKGKGARAAEGPQAPSKEKPVLSPVLVGEDARVMVLVPAGPFAYGRPREERRLPAFYVDKNLVTRADFEAYLRASGATAPASWRSAAAGARSPLVPAVGVGPEEAAAYARWAGKRLLTDEEWEKAARGPGGLPYPWGRVPDAALCPPRRAARPSLVPVGSFSPDGDSPWGVADLCQVWEWTGDRYGELGHVVRGGPWRDDRGPAVLSNQSFETRAKDDVGFRCARDVASPPGLVGG